MLTFEGCRETLGGDVEGAEKEEKDEGKREDADDADDAEAEPVDGDMDGCKGDEETDAEDDNDLVAADDAEIRALAMD